jgi:putative ABC transport system substrate-binding protein
VKKTIIFLLVAALTLVSFQFGEAQQASGKIPRIGYLAGGLGAATRTETFKQGLRDLGYVEGKNIIIEYRNAEGKIERYSDLVADLVGLKVDVIFTSSTPGALAAKNATKTIPIVFTNVGDPVANGLVASLARPGGNITGRSTLAPELSGKGLELLKETIPEAFPCRGRMESGQSG